MFDSHNRCGKYCGDEIGEVCKKTVAGDWDDGSVWLELIHTFGAEMCVSSFLLSSLKTEMENRVWQITVVVLVSLVKDLFSAVGFSQS